MANMAFVFLVQKYNQIITKYKHIKKNNSCYKKNKAMEPNKVGIIDVSLPCNGHTNLRWHIVCLHFWTKNFFLKLNHLITQYRCIYAFEGFLLFLLQ